ncbi:MAG: hypothetical protein IH914_06890 [candidate division Zixibacteria bacterium]|nr:hypothetical protein [candidate division Zixibacteria bacterium]
MKHRQTLTIGLVFMVALLVGCENHKNPTQAIFIQDDEPYSKREQDRYPYAFAPTLRMDNFPAPSGVNMVTFGSATWNVWPYTGENFSGAPQDPINLIFIGDADPLDIRAALLSLDGDRSAFGMPPIAPFNSVWDDAIGDVQTAYSENSGWTGSAIQLECGDHQQLRFHMRLFRAGDITIANVHFEVLIPGTTTHQVLNWELGEQFVIADFIRSGLLDPTTPMVPVAGFNDSPFRKIPSVIYNGLPVELRSLIGGPISDVTEDVPIVTDGNAMILNLAGTAPRIAETRTQSFIIEFNQAVPKPFCADGPLDFLYVTGPVSFEQVSTLSEDGVYETHFSASAELIAQPINPLTGEPTGDELSAVITEKHDSYLSSRKSSASSFKHQALLPSAADGAGQFFESLTVNSNGPDSFDSKTRCGAGASSSAGPAVKGGIGL